MKFTKMHGLGNDYVYVDCTKNKEVIENPSELSIVVSDRHFGIGSDGLILICDSDKCDFKMRIFNADGSEAEMCGNGIRCVGKYVYDYGLTKKKEVSIETLGGIKILKLNVEDNEVKSAIVDMGKPKLDSDDIINFREENNLRKVNLDVLDRNFDFTFISMGNPHVVTIVDNVDEIDVDKYGKIIENDPHFPARTNVEFVEIIDKDNIKMRVYERGAGITLACGTGACASTTACYFNGLINNKVKVNLIGGNLNITYDKDDEHIYMEGPATKVFDGEIKEINIK
ncbi:MAG: diaminopimelate epimerase [Bacilli bacterium]|nr:diaminopimelate epimerase [Bacilli bacterium]